MYRLVDMPKTKDDVFFISCSYIVAVRLTAAMAAELWMLKDQSRDKLDPAPRRKRPVPAPRRQSDFPAPIPRERSVPALKHGRPVPVPQGARTAHTPWRGRPVSLPRDARPVPAPRERIVLVPLGSDEEFYKPKVYAVEIDISFHNINKNARLFVQKFRDRVHLTWRGKKRYYYPLLGNDIPSNNENAMKLFTNMGQIDWFDNRDLQVTSATRRASFLGSSSEMAEARTGRG